MSYGKELDEQAAVFSSIALFFAAFIGIYGLRKLDVLNFVTGKDLLLLALLLRFGILRSKQILRWSFRPTRNNQHWILKVPLSQYAQTNQESTQARMTDPCDTASADLDKLSGLA